MASHVHFKKITVWLLSRSRRVVAAELGGAAIWHNSRGYLLIVVFINGVPWNQKVEVWVVVGFTFIECGYKARVRVKDNGK